jgi:hypothetical protein
MIKQAIFTTLALSAAAMFVGCSMWARPEAAGLKSAYTSATNRQEKNPPAASPYNQPLMATGGDLVMLRLSSHDLAS